MEAWRKNRARGQWSLTWLLAVALHQLILPMVLYGGVVQESFVAYTLYFGIVSFLFTWLFLFLPLWLMLPLIFIFGGFVEVALFGFLPDFILAGILYTIIFVLPYWLSRRIWKGETA